MSALLVFVLGTGLAVFGALYAQARAALIGTLCWYRCSCFCSATNSRQWW